MNRTCSMYGGNGKSLQSVCRITRYVAILHETCIPHTESQEDDTIQLIHENYYSIL